MTLINFSVVKPKISFQLEVTLERTFADVSELVFNHFNLNKSDFPNSKEYKIKFIFDKKVCQESQTLSSLGVTSQSNIFVYLPKALIPVISSQDENKPPEKTINSNNDSQTNQTEKSNVIDSNTYNNNDHNTTTNNNHSNTTTNNDSNTTSTTNNDSNTSSTNDNSNNTTSMPTNNNDTNINDFNNNQNNIGQTFFNFTPTFTKSFQKTDDESMHPIIKRIVDQKILHELVDLGFDETDAAYSLALRKDIDCCVDILALGIPHDPEFRYHINQIASGKVSSTEAVLHDVEIAKIVANKKGENEQIAIATVLGEAAISDRIRDVYAKMELRKKYDEISNLYSTEIHNQIQYDMQHGKQIIFYIQEHRMPYAADFSRLCQFALHYTNQKNQMNYMDNSQYDPIYQMYDEEAQLRKACMENLQDQFNSIFDNIPSMSPNNFVNPFAAVYNEVVKYCDENSLSLYGYGKDLNFDQLKYCYKMVKIKHIDINEVVQYLMASNGDVFAAEALINSIS